MAPNDLSDRTAMVVGASRGLGRGITTALAQAGASVIAVARSETALAELAGGAGNSRWSPTQPTRAWQAVCLTATTRRRSFSSLAQAR